MSTPVPIPPGQAPPFEVIDDQHQAGVIIITGAICLSISLVCLLIRLYVRLYLSPPFAYDDYVLLAATAVAIIQSSVLFSAASDGFGNVISLLDSSTIIQIQDSVVASDVLYLLTIYLSKCCVVAIYLRLTPQKSYKRTSWATLAVCTLWIIPSILIISINCESNKPWARAADQCPNLLARWQFITVLNIATEAFLFALSLLLVKGIQTTFVRKMIILSAFTSRLPLIGFCLLRLYYLHIAIKSDDPSYDSVNTYIWTQVELNYTLITCTIFCLRPFMVAVSTNYGTAGDASLAGTKNNSRNYYGYGSGKARSRNRLQGFTLQSMASSFKKDVTTLSTSSERMKEDDLHVESAAGVRTTISSASPLKSSRRTKLNGPLEGRSSIGSDESTKMIIRKDIEYTVQHHSRKPDGEEPDPHTYGGVTGRYE